MKRVIVELLLGGLGGLVATALTLSLAALPYFMFGKQNSPAFYGSFFGSILTIGGTVLAVVLTARLSEKAQRTRDERLQKTNSLALARMAHIELMSAAVGAESFKDRLSALEVPATGMPASRLTAMQTLWQKTIRLQSVDKYTYELCKLSPEAGAALTICLHIRAKLEMLMESAVETAEKNGALSPENWNGLLSQCAPAPQAFFTAAQQLRLSQGESWVQITSEQMKRSAADWAEFLSRTKRAADAQ